MMRVYVHGIGLTGPGLSGWQVSIPTLRGEQTYANAPANLGVCEMLPAAERRRAGVPIKLALAVGLEAFRNSGREMSRAATVFTSSGGDNDNVHAINEILATAPREVSPTRFHNSVHNAAAGYWCIAAKTHEPSTSLCACDASFAAGLLEAVTQVVIDRATVALIAYDHPYPEPLRAVRPIKDVFGTALVLATEPEDALAAIELDFIAGKGDETTMSDTALETLRTGVPAARSLPLLEALARKQRREIVVAYCDDNHLRIRVDPC